MEPVRRKARERINLNRVSGRRVNPQLKEQRTVACEQLFPPMTDGGDLARSCGNRGDNRRPPARRCTNRDRRRREHAYVDAPDPNRIAGADWALLQRLEPHVRLLDAKIQSLAVERFGLDHVRGNAA